MTTMVFTLPCWKKTRLDVGRFALALLLGCALLAGFARANDNPTPLTISQLQAEASAEGVYVSAQIKIELPVAVEDALLKGVPLYFVAEANVFRERWYWYDKKLLVAERHLRLAYQPLTRRWRLGAGTGSASGQGLSLNQNFDSLPEALAVLQRFANWRIGDATEIELDQRNNVEFRFRLDVSQLPRPFQIGALGQADWNMSASSVQRLSLKSAK